MSDEKAIKEIESLLSEELQQVKKANQNSMIIGGVFTLLIGGYLFWAAGQFGKLLDPEGLALAATGAAVDAVPQASQELRAVVVDGAPDIAQAASQSIVEVIPVYRQLLEDELAPVIDEVSGILAETAVRGMVKALDAEYPEAAEQQALQDAADAAIARLDSVLMDAMDEPMEDDGPTPRDTIEESLNQLKMVDKGLKRIAAGGGDAQEREFLMAWMNLLIQYDETATAAADDEVRTKPVGPDGPKVNEPPQPPDGEAGGDAEKAGPDKGKAGKGKAGKGG